MLANVCSSNWKSTWFAPATATPRGTPRPSTRMLRFVPRLLRSVGLGPVLFPPARCFGHRAIHRLIGPLDLVQRVVFLEPQRPQLFKHPGLRPCLEAAMRRTAG